MSIFATAHYHVNSPEMQAFHIDADGVKGNLIAPELASTPVALHDLRTMDRAVSFKADGLGYARVPSRIHDFDDSLEWTALYDQEIAAFLRSKIGVKDVIVFDHTVRVDDNAASRKPARNVHGDYSANGAEKRLIDLLGEDRAAQWSKGHYGFINTWRPIKNAISSTPLAFVHPKTVAPEDWIDVELIYPDRRGQIMGLVHNEDHEWLYLSRMRPEEIFYFNVYDNKGRAPVAHSALEFVEEGAAQTTRMSIESRTLVRYD